MVETGEITDRQLALLQLSRDFALQQPGYSRVVIAPYRVEPADAQSDKPYPVDGEMIAIAEAPVVFAS